MNRMDQKVRIDSSDELAARRDELLTAAPAVAPGAFAELYATYSRRLYKTILAITRNPEDAEDALQETFLRVHLRFATFEGRSSIYSWLTRIAINSTLTILRRRRARPETLFDPQPDPQADAPCFEIKDSSPNPEQICDLRQRKVRVLRAIRDLEPQFQAPLWMRITRGSSIEQIGRTLNISQATVKSRLYRARRRLFSAQDLKPPKPRSQSLDLHDGGVTTNLRTA